MSGMDELRARPGEWVKVGPHWARLEPEPLMRPQPPEVWSHLVAFVRERLAESQDEADPWPAIGALVDLAADAYDPRASGPGDSAVDAEEVMWHLAATWRDHPAFAAVLGREYDRLTFVRGGRMPVDRETWIREWRP